MSLEHIKYRGSRSLNFESARLTVTPYDDATCNQIKKTIMMPGNNEYKGNGGW